MNFDMMEILKNASGIQTKMAEMQKKMENISETGYAGGDMVQVVMNGKMQIISVKISPEAVDASDTSFTEDLVKSACSDAYEKIRNRIAGEFSYQMGGLNMPPGFMGL